MDSSELVNNYDRNCRHAFCLLPSPQSSVLPRLERSNLFASQSVGSIDYVLIMSSHCARRGSSNSQKYDTYVLDMNIYILKYAGALHPSSQPLLDNQNRRTKQITKIYNQNRLSKYTTQMDEQYRKPIFLTPLVPLKLNCNVHNRLLGKCFIFIYKSPSF